MERAIDLARPWGAMIHLVQLRRSWNLLEDTKSTFLKEEVPDEDLDRYIKVLLCLIHWKNRIERNSSGITVRIHYKSGISLQSLVIQTAQKEQLGLIILAFNPGMNWWLMGRGISPGRLTQKTGSNVLSIETKVKDGFSEEMERLFTPRSKMVNRTGLRDFTAFNAGGLRNLWSAN